MFTQLYERSHLRQVDAIRSNPADTGLASLKDAPPSLTVWVRTVNLALTMSPAEARWLGEALLAAAAAAEKSPVDQKGQLFVTTPPADLVSE